MGALFVTLVQDHVSRFEAYIETSLFVRTIDLPLLRMRAYGVSKQTLSDLPTFSLVPRPSHVFQRCTRKREKAWSIM
jgi:hypothetical protein